MITASIIPKEERLTFYPCLTKQFRLLKRMLHHFSGIYLEDYYRKGGRYWEFVTLSNQGEFAYPVMDAPITFHNPRNNTNETFSQEATGICIWLMALDACQLVMLERNHFVEMGNFSYYQSLLMEYASKHSEWNSIARVIGSGIIRT
ncbi:TPA: antirestriction protein [Vibrio parahaemolyticus]|nr:antirestriction protein [Vibrio parahaemolyticus]EIA1343258.1 antirestriction protein [Vibrio parahaemolyticus]EIA1590344.1 antirestriction protein [Vibrio parahaemolyticus]EIA1769332.1 antirestriction protein [Vibrio parahaemolyticus]EJE8675398.1 antirestriction protein [Vibrio parahaemolyticus]